MFLFLLSGLLISTRTNHVRVRAPRISFAKALFFLYFTTGATTTTTTTTTTTAAPVAPCSRECTRIYVPLCGSDGRSYNNKCLLDVASCESLQAGGGDISVVSEGLCGPPVTSAPATTTSAPASSCDLSCVGSLVPVCGSDGDSYDSECLLREASCRNLEDGKPAIRVVSNGECGPKSEETYVPCRRCRDVYVPVCGSDGRTYDNECVMDNFNCRAWRMGKRGVYIVRNGVCGHDDYDDDDDDYDEQSTSLQASSSGTSPLLSSFGATASTTASSSCPDRCPEDLSPVCGSDGVTYDSECVLLSSSCEGGSSDVAKASDGPCVAVPPRGPVCDEGCDERLDPVCASDGVTYGNGCLLSLADCLNPFESVTFVSRGSCDSSSIENDSSSEEVELKAYLPPV